MTIWPPCWEQIRLPSASQIGRLPPLVEIRTTIRLVVREACTGERGSLTDGFFPDIVLRVK